MMKIAGRRMKERDVESYTSSLYPFYLLCLFPWYAFSISIFYLMHRLGEMVREGKEQTRERPIEETPYLPILSHIVMPQR